MPKNKYLFFITFLFVFLFLCCTAASALEVTSYPKIPGYISPSTDCAGKDCLPIYAAYWFGILIYLAGAISLISFAIGAVSLIASADNAERKKNARDRILGAVLGLVLTLTSFLILRTINTAFIEPAVSPLPGVAGVFYTNNTEDKPCPMENSDTSTIPAGFNNIKYVCASGGPALLAWMFPKPGLESVASNIKNANVLRIECNTKAPISGKSFKLAFETPGVYYCLNGCSGDMCKGYMSLAIVTSESAISAPFNGKVKGVRIVNDAGAGDYYGVIFHEEAGLDKGGECAYPLINNSSTSKCKGVTVSAAAAADIFKWSNENPPKSSGTGVDFFSEPFGYNAGAQSRGEGFCKISNNNIKNMFKQSADKLIFDEKNKTYSCGYTLKTGYTINLYKNRYKTFQDRHGSIDIKGDYLVGLYGAVAGDSSYCQIFSKNVPDLNVQPIIASGHTIGSIYIIPLKK